jgi:cobalt-zinc-cadmium efflux system protein
MHQPTSQRPASANIKTAFFLNITFTVFEIIGGVWTNSMAIISDALHDLGDSLSLGLSWYLERVARKKRDQRFSFGYGRFSLLAALINSIVLIGGSVIILREAIPRLLAPETVNVPGMFLLAIVGMLVNGAAVLRVRKGKTLNEQVVSWHLLEDVLGWAVVGLVSIIMWFWSIPVLDPALSILITTFIVWQVFKRLKTTVTIFLQGTPPGLDIAELEAKIANLEGVQSVHDTHAWTLDGEYIILSTHVVVPDNFSLEKHTQLKNRIKELCRGVNIQHVTVETEREDEGCDQVDC